MKTVNLSSWITEIVSSDEIVVWGIRDDSLSMWGTPPLKLNPVPLKEGSEIEVKGVTYVLGTSLQDVIRSEDESIN